MHVHTNTHGTLCYMPGCPSRLMFIYNRIDDICNASHLQVSEGKKQSWFEERENSERQGELKKIQ